MSFTGFKIKLCSLLFICFCAGASAQKFDKAAFYQSLQASDSILINKQIALLQTSKIKEKQAYEGALLLKQAGLLSGKKNKLASFKAGKTKLENALEKDSTNTEYHFLRLLVQENAPKILGYYHNLEIDNIYICKNFKKLSPALQQVILAYSKKSNILSNLSIDSRNE